ncbi:MAG TPA: C39 family peptidase, partial [Anaerolineae bacterium]|nr:C39 family peptidase [Anaerolineae bacterium]
PTATPEPTATATPLPPATPHPPQTIITGLENRPQTFNNCGPANMSMVLNFFDDATSQTDAALYLKPNPEDRNVSPWQISDYVSENTSLRSITRSGGTLEMLEQFIAMGIPVVIEKGYDPPTDEGWYGHYLTMFGYDRAAQEFYSMDTYLGPWDNSGRIDSYDEINFYWQQFNYTFYVIYPPHREAEVYAILGEDMLDDFTMWQNAALRAQAEKDADPENAFAWFNMGTNLTRMGELTGEQQYYQSGATAFDQARTIGLPGRMMWYQFRPYLAYMRTQRYQDMKDLADSTLTTSGGRNVEETYLYRGHAMAFLGDLASARSDYQRALQLNKNFYVAQIALDSLP